MIDLDNEKVWEPQSETEQKIFEGMDQERRQRKVYVWMVRWRARIEDAGELKEIKNAYHTFKEFGRYYEDLELKILLHYARMTIDGSESLLKHARTPELWEFFKGNLEVAGDFFAQIICLHEAKKRVKRETLDETKEEVLERERETGLTSGKDERR